MITDLFSHKIHSSNAEWQDKLVELAAVFSEFDGQPYDRNAIENRLLSISPRASVAARDPSKFRDEISAYPAYLGLYHFQHSGDRWILRLSETAKTLLVVEEPNVPSFMLLQMLLFQYPNGMGFAYHPNSGNLRIQANVRDRTLNFIREDIHLSPLRLICKALMADSIINGINSLHPRVTIPEIFILANDARTNRKASPDITMVSQVLGEARSGRLTPPPRYESRFHILNHTDFLQITNGVIHLRAAISPEDATDLQRKLETINNVTCQFNGFDNATDEAQLKSVMFDGQWGRYFDGIVSMSADTVQTLTNDLIISAPTPDQEPASNETGLPIDYSKLQFRYPLKEREEYQAPQQRNSKKREQADPEVTKIKRQRSNLSHKIITQKVDEYLRNLGATLYENEHIDLFAKIPNDGSYLFEIKSVSTTNLLSQTRKGLSQLYEYRYRYLNEVGEDVILCLVFPKEPNEIGWLIDYLCLDRKIAICWFDDDSLKFPDHCAEQLQRLIVDSR